VYESSVTFFASSSSAKSGTALQNDEFAQRRINSYVGVVRSERLAKIILEDTGLDLTPLDVSESITAMADADTVLLNVRVQSTSTVTAQAIATAVADNLDAAIAELDNRGNQSSVELRVISGPTLAPEPVSPRKTLNLGLGVLLGLGLAIAQAIVRQQLDSSFHGREQLAQVTGVPTLGVLNDDRSARKTPILTPTTHHSRRAETFRQVRTNLRFVDAARPVEVLLVTSSLESEGKTTTAANLGVIFAESGRRVLLVDADLRKPKLERYLDLEGSAGLVSVLIGDAELDDVVQEWGANNLSVLASGPIPPNPSELLGSEAMEKLMLDARAKFDTIIIDSPPLLPVTDAAVTAAQADGVLLVVRHGSTRRDQVQQSLAALESVDARVLGTVLTMAPHSRRDALPSYYEEQGRKAERP